MEEKGYKKSKYLSLFYLKKNYFTAYYLYI